MKIKGTTPLISASDLSNHLACSHVTTLDLLAVRGEMKRDFREDPRIDALIERGKRHEQKYLSELSASGLKVVHGNFETIDAMKSGVDVIAQAYLNYRGLHGYADALKKVNSPSKLGDWSYEVVDTKLARETKGGSILQLCLYSELVAAIQGFMPEWMHIITPEYFRSRRDASGTNSYRTHDYLAYYRFVKARLEKAIQTTPGTYPDPVDHCEICSWWPSCNEHRRKDDHLSFVAGISKLQMRELRNREIFTLANLAVAKFTERPERGSIESYEKIRHQAKLQLESRTTHKPVHDLLTLEAERGLARLPEPSQGDIFFDFESDPFVEESGIEYLLGYLVLDERAGLRPAPTPAPTYTALWGLNRIDERKNFERFIDLITQRWELFPDLHIYHFSPYDPAALKRLAGRYSSKEDELDRMLRAGLFVDLHSVLKQTLRAGIERYSLKDLEIFFDFKRKIDLRDATKCRRDLECALELNTVDDVSKETLNTVEAYNFEDCYSTLMLRNWLETIRTELIDQGKEILRPTVQSPEPSDAVNEQRTRVLALMQRLLAGISPDPNERTAEQHAKSLIAFMLEWHRREDKATWWEYYRMKELSDQEFLEEREAISGMEFVERIGGTARCPIHRYRFPFQDTEVREGDQLETCEGTLGDVEAINRAALTVDIKKRMKMKEKHPSSAFVFNHIDSGEKEDSLFRLGTWIADHGIFTRGPYRAARDLLLRYPPRGRVLDPPLPGNAIVLQLDHSVLPIQGPPGAGKTYTGARMICELVRNHKKVGVTAMSHKVIRKLLDEVVKAAKEEGLQIQCIQKVGDKSEEPVPEIIEAEYNDDVLQALTNNEVRVAAGTAWLWSREDLAETLDVLFVDEAGQMSLADVLAVSQAAKSVVLLGDPRQLEQPLQGTHPPGVAVSALEHILGEAETMPSERGLFLEHTWRLAPKICEFTSELFYDNRLESRKELSQQKLEGQSRFGGSGLFFVPVDHEGNQSSSDEEVSVVSDIVNELTGMTWIDQEGQSHPITLDDILIVAPYNAQVFKLSERIHSDRIGTVDKFQGQEAPVVIYSMTTSSPEEAPRGMEFLYSLNRLNVATSRARCVCILVANPKLFEPECKTPRQMKLANALCRYLEMTTKSEGTL